jgi:hypothetical protein
VRDLTVAENLNSHKRLLILYHESILHRFAKAGVVMNGIVSRR